MNRPPVRLTEAEIEQHVIELLRSNHYDYTPGQELSPSGPSAADRAASPPVHYLTPARRDSLDEVILKDHLEIAINRLNPGIPQSSRREALKKVLSIPHSNYLDANREFHQYLRSGVPVDHFRDGQETGQRVRLIDFQNPGDNLWLSVGQIGFRGFNRVKRPDIVLYVNGLPLVIIELKSPADRNATLKSAYDQLQTYTQIIPQLFHYIAFSVISDGAGALAGVIGAPFSRFFPWKSPDDENAEPLPPLETLVRHMLSQQTFLDLIRHFILFENETRADARTGQITSVIVKKMAAAHQYYAVRKAVKKTLQASGPDGGRKIGVIWHTQGSGKSLSMVFYSALIVQEMNNPTIVVITDRNDLDDQLFNTFAACFQLLNQTPQQAASREELKTLLKTAHGGVVFTTIQKFYPESPNIPFQQLSDRDDIVVIADEAHRSQYGFKARLDSKTALTKYGFAAHLRKALPNARFIGFTGTPLETADTDTRRVFGDYIDIYDIARAEADKATVPIFYENRAVRLTLTESGANEIKLFDQALRADESGETERDKERWTRMEAIIGHPDRLRRLAEDIAAHFEARRRRLEGKGMIVVMSRRIAVALYDELIRIRPHWASPDIARGELKVVITSASSDKSVHDAQDPDETVIPEIHRTTRGERKILSGRLKNPDDPLRLVIVCDMWLTGFDVPCLHAMYLDKLMRRHTLMQAIARVNRVFNDKPGGLIVDYIGVGDALREAMGIYAASGRRGTLHNSQEQAVELLGEKMEILRRLFDGLDYHIFFNGNSGQRIRIILQAVDHILSRPDLRERFMKETTLALRLQAIAAPHEDIEPFIHELAFFCHLRERLYKLETDARTLEQEARDSIVRRLVVGAVKAMDAVDIFEAAGLDKPQLHILTEEFLKEIERMPYRHLALELLRKVIGEEIGARRRSNIVSSRKLLERLEVVMARYHNNLVATVEVIAALMELARDIFREGREAGRLNLSDEEYAFYTALADNESAVQVLGDTVLGEMAREIAEKVRRNTTIDWNLRESDRAKLRVIVKRILNLRGYPPDKQEKAVELVVKQAENFAEMWNREIEDGITGR